MRIGATECVNVGHFAGTGKPYDFLSIAARERKYARKKVEKKVEEAETEKRDTSTREVDPDEEGAKKKAKIVLKETL